jgi:hypothetical protein
MRTSIGAPFSRPECLTALVTSSDTTTRIRSKMDVGTLGGNRSSSLRAAPGARVESEKVRAISTPFIWASYPWGPQ